MEIKQLIQKNCNTGEYESIFPSTSIDSVIDPVTGESLKSLVSNFNHLYLPFIKNSRQLTRLSIPKNFRKKGLWITYRSCKGNVVTEYYNSDNMSDEEWRQDKNWTKLSSDLSDEIMKLLDNKVDEIEGMGLSSNDFTDAYKAKVDSTITYNDLGNGFNVDNKKINIESITEEELEQLLN